jgi:hypothetical protein
VGLFKKKEDNKLSDYIEMVPDSNLFGLGPDIGKDFEEMVKLKLKQMSDNPEQYFNFGFTYNDFKAYLFKITYCRSMRKFIERMRLDRIKEFQENNNFTFGFDMELEQQP